MLTERADPRGSSARSWMPAAVGAAALLVFLPVVRHELLLWDDAIYVVTNERIQSLDFRLIRFAFTQIHAAFWMPLTWLSLALDHAIGGGAAWAFHLTNALLHAGNVALMAVLSSRWIAHAVPNWSARSRSSAAAIAALVWGLHPLRVESVAWVAERKDVLSGMFFLLALLAYDRYAGGPDPGRVRWLTASIAATVLAGMAKPVVVSLPVVLVLVDAYPYRRWRHEHALRIVLEKLPFVAIAAGVSAVTMVAQRPAMGLVGDVGLFARALVACRAIAEYLRMTLWPSGLSPLYPYPAKADIAGAAYWVAAALAPIVTAVLAIWTRRGLVIWLLYLVTLAPSLGIVQVGRQAMGDRFTYLPSIFASVVVGAAFQVVLELFRSVGRTTATSIAITLGVLLAGAGVLLTIRQIHFWRNGIEVWTRVLTVEPTSGLAYYNRSREHELRGEFVSAIGDMSRAIDIGIAKGKRDIALLWAARAAQLLEAGRPDQAAGDYSRAIDASPSPAAAHLLGRAKAFEAMGDPGAAAADREAAGRIVGTDAAAEQ